MGISTIMTRFPFVCILRYIRRKSTMSDIKQIVDSVRYALKTFSVSLFYIGYERNIGVATLPEQIHRQLVKRKYDFTLMVKNDEIIILIFQMLTESSIRCTTFYRDLFF